jgi:segregation and condensation protein B
MRLVRDDDYVDVMELQESPIDSDAPFISSDRDRQSDPADARRDPADAQGDPVDSADLPDGALDTDALDTDAVAAAGDESASAPEAESVDLRTLEALLLSTHHPLTAGRLAELLSLGSTRPLKRAIKTLNEQYIASDRSFRIEQVAGGYQILTLAEFAAVLQLLHQRESDAKLTKAALETLAIIAYKQPVLRADVEAIRGVACGETLRSLMEKRLVKIAGRAEVPGRPILYGTTRRFLELFGLNSLKDLPQSEDQLRPRDGGA